MKARLLSEHPDHPTAIRLHRTFSWLARCEQIEAGQDNDVLLICLWIGFNGLYGRWDEQRREPLPDRQCWRDFVERLLTLDTEGRIGAALVEQRDLVMSLLDDEYLSEYFWEEPTEARAGKSKKARFDARTWYLEGKWGLLLDRLLERVYLLRCQLIHGAATHGGKLNRASLARCAQMMSILLDRFLTVMIDQGGGEDWGAMCYPPLKPSTRT